MKETRKFEIKIDPLDLHEGLKDNMAEFESKLEKGGNSYGLRWQEDRRQETAQEVRRRA